MYLYFFNILYIKGYLQILASTYALQYQRKSLKL